MGHVLTENRNVLVVDAATIWATSTAERQAAEAMTGAVPGQGRITLGADKAFDAAEHVTNLREMNVTPHVAQNTTNRTSAVYRRTTRHPGYELSQRIRKRIKEGFGWIKVPGGLRKTRHRGFDRVGWSFTLTGACNLNRLPKLLAAWRLAARSPRPAKGGLSRSTCRTQPSSASWVPSPSSATTMMLSARASSGFTAHH